MMLTTFALALCAVIPAADAPARPNVVMILIDDLGRNDLGCYGSSFYKTPQLDRLAADGMKFTDAYAACPVCSPTRAALMTGKYPARLNLTDWLPGRGDRPDQKLLRPAIHPHLPLEEVTLAEALRAAGYATGHVGKWHLGGQGFEPTRQGFDWSLAGNQAGSPASYFAPYKNKAGAFMPGLADAPDGEYLTDRLNAEAEKFIEQNRARPFFLYLSHYTAHIPLFAKPELVAKYQAGKPNQPLPLGRQGNPIYAAMLESLDDGIGRIVKKLADLGLSERTALFFTSDNGGLCTLEGPHTPATINSPLREGKGFLYEGGTRVSLLAKLPGVIQPGSVSATPVSSIDFFPTILDLCGVKSEAAVDGMSLLPVLRDGQATLPRDALYWHYPHYSNQGGKPGGAVRSGDFKLIEFYETGRRELFNVKQDLGEGRNLIEDKPDLANDLAAKLSAWREQVGARMMKPNPEFVPNPSAANGNITLHARTAEVHGVMLRYEPLPHKETLGYWVRPGDWASWEFEVKQPGRFTVEILQGCGTGHGGSEVEFTVANQTLTTKVEDTGHFQNFKAREIGAVQLASAGRFTLTVKPKTKPGGAVMDLRQVTLQRMAE